MTQKHPLLRGLAGVADDLWGSPVTEKPQKKPEQTETVPSFDAIWKTADETVDWTEALGSASSPDGLTDQATWDVYRQYAPRVLAGDVGAYTELIALRQPLKDLAEWTEHTEVLAESADLLTVQFRPLAGKEEDQAYLAGISLRMARDLFALLPVTQVRVEAAREEKTLLAVSFEKGELMKVRFAFIDPVEFVLRCGGAFSE